MKQYKFKITGLDCANCSSQLERDLQKVKGIENVMVNFMMQRLTFECQESDYMTLLPKIKKAIHKSEPGAQIEEV